MYSIIITSLYDCWILTVYFVVLFEICLQIVVILLIRKSKIIQSMTYSSIDTLILFMATCTALLLFHCNKTVMISIRIQLMIAKNLPCQRKKSWPKLWLNRNHLILILNIVTYQAALCVFWVTNKIIDTRVRERLNIFFNKHQAS